jgi:hypothetical protein
MLMLEEQIELNLSDEKVNCGKHGMIYLNFPIRDEIADSNQVTIDFIDILEEIHRQSTAKTVRLADRLDNFGPAKPLEP